MLRAGNLLALLSLVLQGCGLTPASELSWRGFTPAAAAGDGEMEREYLRLRSRAAEHAREQKLRVQRVGQHLLSVVPEHPRVRFVIVAGDPSVNAGATFGQVAVTSGMLAFLKSDDEVAVVLGHELAHLTQGHVTKGLIGSVALTALEILAESRAPGAGRAAGAVGQLFLNHYTQTQEREADEVGLRYAYQAGYDPSAAVDVMERLAVELPQSMTAGYFSTHPSSVERAVLARREAESLLGEGPTPTPGRTSDMEALAGAALQSSEEEPPVAPLVTVYEAAAESEQGFARVQRPFFLFPPVVLSPRTHHAPHHPGPLRDRVIKVPVPVRHPAPRVGHRARGR